MVAPSSLWSIVLLASASLVAGHGAIVRATGDAGGQGSAIGIDASTPRDDTRRNSGQQDATRFKNAAAATCGETLAGGANDIQAGIKAVETANGGTLPQVNAAGGTLSMTLHQVNGDGAGPYECMMDPSGAGTNWTPIQVTQQVPGNDGRNRDGATTDFPLDVAIPAGTTCTGAGAVCMVRCENPANAGPFGGCIPFQMAGANGTAAAAPAAAAPAAAPAAAAKLRLRSAKMARGLAVRKVAQDDDEFWS